MADPTKKDPKIEELLDSMTDRTNRIEKNVCTFCGKPATVFRDDISRKEYRISGLCQECQDKVFQ